MLRAQRDLYQSMKVIPNYLNQEQKQEKKIMAICKYFGHSLPCPFMKRGKCRQVHDNKVKEAHDLIVQRGKNREEYTKREIELTLDPMSQLTEIQMKVKVELVTRYPKPPTDKDLQRALAEKERVAIEEEFQKMYGEEDD